MDNQSTWLKMRSDIYLRDKGICWICSGFVDLADYDLGHLVDRCMGGSDTYDNLAVMHTPCNLSKPKHKTLEDAVRWQLTATIGNIRPTVNSDPLARHKPRHPRQGGTAIPTPPIQPPQTPLIDYHQPIYIIDNKQFMLRKRVIPNYEILKEQSNNQELIDKIKPATLCWIQGNPQWQGEHRSPMWRLLPPPYTKDVAFVMRQTPPEAIETGSLKLIDTMQVLRGTLTQEVDIQVGFIAYHITPNGTNRPTVKVKASPDSNSGQKGSTIGMGIGQIPLTEWQTAKALGMKLKDFKTQYLAKHPLPPAPVVNKLF